MSQDWIYNIPLVDKHGNFGSIEGDGAAAMRYCVTGETLINTGNGLVRIDNLVKNTRRNSDNPINIMVKSMQGKQNKSDMLFNSSYQKVIRIILQNGMSVTGSYNHPILVSSGNGKCKWVLAKDLKEGMEVVVDTNTENAMFGNNDDIAQAMAYANAFKKNKKDIIIPDEVLQGTRTYLLVYIKTLFGNSNKLITKSEEFARQLQVLMATQLGFLSSKYYNEASRQYVIKMQDSSEAKRYTLVPIKKLHKLPDKEIVYSIRVNSKCHSYTGNGFINHNTEARLSKAAQELLLSDIDKDTVDFVPNYDDTEKEPVLLPAKIPNLLVSGSEGIAVGMACSIPTHNVGEVIDAVKLMLSKKKVTLDEVLEIIKGPDFATGGIISNKKDLYDIYRTGNGKIRIRGKAEIIEQNGKPCIKITEIPATMIGAIDKFISDICNLIRERKAPDIVNVSNLSGKDGIQIIIELKKGANAQKNLNMLYKKAKLEDTFSFNMLAIKDNKPKVYPLLDYLQEFIDYQMIINERKYRYLLAKRLREREIKEGLIKAIDCIDLIVEILRGSKSKKDAMNCLMNGDVKNITFKTKKSEKAASGLRFTETQTEEILAMPLQRLIGLELEALQKELDRCNKEIKEYEGYLSSPTKMKNRIKSDLEDIKNQYATPRKTAVSDEKEIVLEKEEIEEQNFYLLIDRFHYAKLIDEATYQRNLESIPKDFKHCIYIKNTDKLLVFVDSGKMHQVKVTQIPLCKYKDKGTPLENISNLVSSENVIFIDSLENVQSKKLIFVNDRGFTKIVPGTEFIVTTKTAVATKLQDGAKVLFVDYDSEENNEMIFSTKAGMFIRFKTAEISEMKKNANGVRGIKLKEDDIVDKCFLGNSQANFVIDGTEYPFQKIKLSKRDGVGTKTKFS
jgi:DNA gyrase subunit A